MYLLFKNKFNYVVWIFTVPITTVSQLGSIMPLCYKNIFPLPSIFFHLNGVQ